MGKSIIAPIVGFLIVLVELIFGIEVGQDVASQIIEWLVAGASLVAIVYGIFKNHKKPPKEYDI